MLFFKVLFPKSREYKHNIKLELNFVDIIIYICIYQLLNKSLNKLV